MNAEPGDGKFPPVQLEHGHASSTATPFRKADIPLATPRFCAEGHPMIQWFDPSIETCPLCEAKTKIVVLEGEVYDLLPSDIRDQSR